MVLPFGLTACDSDGSGDESGIKHVDYVEKVKLDFNSETKKQQVVVRQHVDGDTTHFDPIPSELPGCNNAADFSSDKAPITTRGYAKARYIGINTPESTGQIEPYGKTASNFTKSKLKSATSIIIESDDDQWNIDSTGGRYLLWVWYMPEGGTDYRNLNIEILQAGLAFGSGTDENRYGEDAYAALLQAQAEKLYVFSGENDPDFYYGGPVNTTLKDLRLNSEKFVNKKVVIEGTVVAFFNNVAYVEQTYYDIEGHEEGITLGMPVFCFPNPGSKVLEILSIGNRVSVVGTLIYDESRGYQLTGIQPYNRREPDNPDNCQLLEEVGLDDAFNELIPSKFVSNLKSISIEVEDVDEDGKEITKTVKMTYKEAVFGTSVTASNLLVTSVYTTDNGGQSDGAMTLTCKSADGYTITIRTEVLRDANGNLMTEEDYLGKTITVKGLVEKYNGTYQIKCHRADYISVLD